MTQKGRQAMKKLLSIILMACMIVTLTPIACGGALTQGTAYAETSTELSSSNLSTHISNWDSKDDTLKLKAGSYQLTEDITIDKTLEIIGTTTLDLNGHVLSLAQGKTGSVIKVTDGGLTLEDSNTSTEHKFSQTAEGQWYLNDINGTRTITGGVITGGNNVENGGGVCVGVGKTFNMNGGTIFGCNAKHGGGIYIY